MPKKLKTYDIDEKSFWFKTKITDYKANPYIKAKLTLPSEKVRELNLENKKLKVTIEVLDDE